VLNVGLVFLRAPGDEAIRSSDPARRRRCGPRPHEARTLPRRTDAVRHCGDRQTQLHGGGRLIVTCTATTASHATDSSRDPQSLAAQNIPFRRDPAGQPGHGSAVYNGRERALRPSRGLITLREQKRWGSEFPDRGQRCALGHERRIGCRSAGSEQPRTRKAIGICPSLFGEAVPVTPALGTESSLVVTEGPRTLPGHG
jgi:hypothetical protein